MNDIQSTQRGIGTWLKRTLQALGSSLPEPQACIDRIQQELDELRMVTNKVGPPDYDAMRAELADVFITCFATAYVIGMNVETAIEAKMAINRGRQWRLSGPGLIQHVKSTAEAAGEEE